MKGRSLYSIYEVHDEIFIYDFMVIEWDLGFWSVRKLWNDSLLFSWQI